MTAGILRTTTTADNGFSPSGSETISLSVIGKLWIPASDPSLARILVMPAPFEEIFMDLPVSYPIQLNAHLISLLKEPSICGSTPQLSSLNQGL